MNSDNPNLCLVAHKAFPTVNMLVLVLEITLVAKMSHLA